MGLGHDRLRPRIGEHVGDIGGLEMPVDGKKDQPGAQGGLVGDHPLRSIPAQDGDDIADLEALGGEDRGERIDLCVELPEGDHRTIGGDDGRPFGVMGGDAGDLPPS